MSDQRAVYLPEPAWAEVAVAVEARIERLRREHADAGTIQHKMEVRVKLEVLDRALAKMVNE